MIHQFASLPTGYSKLLEELIIKTLKTQDHFTWALSGGSTPIALFQELARNYQTQIPWSKIHFFWGDERCVPPDHPESNYLSAMKHLFSKLEIPRENIHRMKGEEDPEKESKRYASVLAQELPSINGLPSLDLNMLGVGLDGHTASIFPGQEHLLSATKWCSVGTHPESGQKRITLTGPILRNARHLHIIASGAAKSPIIQSVLEKNSSYPITQIINGLEPLWILDNEVIINK